MREDRSATSAGGQRELVPSPEAQIAWAAGLFEGEGTWNSYPHKLKSNKYRAVQCRLAMTDRDVVEKFASVVGFGTVRERPVRPDRPHEKPCFEWYTNRRANVRQMIEMFWPYLGERRKARAEEILALGPAKAMAERTHCPQGHPYEGDNLEIERRIVNGKVSFKRRCKICRTLSSRERARRRLGVTPDRYRV